MQIGIDSFVINTPDPLTNNGISTEDRMSNLLAEIECADRAGLDVFGIGEHHRPDFADSAPAVILAAAASCTQRIRLTSAVTVLSAHDPVRVFQDFATLDLISKGRAEMIVGRGSFIDAFPLFGLALKDYDSLFIEKLDLLLKIRASPTVHWSGKHRAALTGQGVYPRPVQSPLPIWLGVGGTPESFIRAGVLGLPLMVAIIGGNPGHFRPLIDLYREAGREAGTLRKNSSWACTRSVTSLKQMSRPPPTFLRAISEASMKLAKSAAGDRQLERTLTPAHHPTARCSWATRKRSRARLFPWMPSSVASRE